MLFSRSNNRFLTRLQQCPGGPWTLIEGQQQLDALVVQPDPHSFDPSLTDMAQFVDFLENTFHRRLLQCFVGKQVHRVWTVEALLKQTRPPSLQALLEALEWCRFWHLAVEKDSWQGHPRLETINNLGWTFEWIVQALLERDYDAQVRRHVKLSELADRGEIDVLAMLEGRSLLVECKSSSKGLTDHQLDRFVAKGRGFPAAQALLLIDTDDPHQMQQRLGQLGQAVSRAFGDASALAIQRHEGSSMLHLRENLYVADTGGGISMTVQAILGDPTQQS